MALSVLHAKSSVNPDGSDSSQVQPSDWNAQHTLSGFGGAALLNVGTIAGTVMAGDDARLTALQPGDATLTALAGLNSTPGYVVQTGVDLFTKRIFTAGIGLTISDGDGVAAATQYAFDQTYGDGRYQIKDSTLTALAAYNTSGLLTQIAPDTFVGRTLAVTGVGLTLTDGAGLVSNPSFALSSAVQAVHTLVAAASAGFMVMTGANAVTARSLAAGTGITITAVDGVAGNPTIAVNTAAAFSWSGQHIFSGVAPRLNYMANTGPGIYYDGVTTGNLWFLGANGGAPSETQFRLYHQSYGNIILVTQGSPNVVFVGGTLNASSYLQENGVPLTSKYAQLGAGNVFTTSQAIDPGLLTINHPSGGQVFLRRDGATANGDTLGIIYFYGRDSASVDTQYGYMYMRATNAANGAETSECRIITSTNGVLGTPVVLTTATAAFSGTISEAGVLLSSKYQAGDAMLTSLAAVPAGLVTCYSAGAAATARSIVAGANITVTNGNGVSGNPTIAVSGLGNAAFYTIGASGNTVPFCSYGVVWGPATQTLRNTNVRVANFDLGGTDGFIVGFQRDSVDKGSVDVHNGICAYNTFMGAHVTQMRPDVERPTDGALIGTIMESVDELAEWTDPADENEHLPRAKISDTPASRAVYGVFRRWDDDPVGEPNNPSNDFTVAGLGAFFIRITAAETVTAGDLIESNGDGCGRRQADDVIRASTVGKVSAGVKVYVYPDGSYTVPATLYCG